MILGINSVSHTWHIVEYSCVLIFMKNRKKGKQKGKGKERKEEQERRKKGRKGKGGGRKERRESSYNVLCLVLLLSQ